MHQLYKINLINALVFIGCGLGGFIGRYLGQSNFQPNALIPAVLGLLLLVMTPGLKSENKIIIRVVVLLTLIFGVFIGYMCFQELASGVASNRKIIVCAIITVSSIVSFMLYISRIVKGNRVASKM